MMASHPEHLIRWSSDQMLKIFDETDDSRFDW
jgi:hypothetical protein